MFCKKSQSRLDAASHNVAGFVQDTLKHAPERLGGLKESVGDALSHVRENVNSERLDEWKSTAGSVFGHLKESVAALEPRLEAMQANLQKAQQHTSHHAHEAVRTADQAGHALWDKAAPVRAHAGRKAQEAIEEARHQAAALRRKAPAPAITVVRDSNEKWLWLAVGLGVGAALGLLLAPASGRRSRALLRDKLAGGGHKAADLGESAASRAVDAANRARGLAHKVADRVRPGEDDADDNTIADRVRTALGENVALGALDRLNIDCFEGRITVRGPVVNATQEAAIKAAIAGVKGVREVRSELLVEDVAETETFIG